MKVANNIFVTLPVILLLLGFISDTFWFWSALSTILTGIAQLIIAFVWTFVYRGNTDLLLKIYWLSTIAFFLLFMFLGSMWIWILPPCIAIYFTLILNTKFDVAHIRNYDEKYPDNSIN